jgi:hypothetical protein
VCRRCQDAYYFITKFSHPQSPEIEFDQSVTSLRQWCPRQEHCAGECRTLISLYIETKMRNDRAVYGSLNEQTYEKLNTEDEGNVHQNNLASLCVLNGEADAPVALSPETDTWECTTTLACCALNAFMLAFDLMAFVPVIKEFESDFNFNAIQVTRKPVSNSTPVSLRAFWHGSLPVFRP